MSRGPYDVAPDHQFWRKAVADLPGFALDPVVSMPFEIAGGDKVATAGSCFAQRIAQALQAEGSNYYIVETDPAGASGVDALRRGYGVFSCRYANIYTTRQLLQLCQRAFGLYTPSLEWWHRKDGRLVDPFRSLVEPDGFEDVDALRADREVHLAAVRRMLETMDVFVFTLGQTECWRTRLDGAVVPLAPGIAGGTWDEGAYAFCNLDTREIVADLLSVIDLVRGVNAEARVILTVSPVPLAATWEARHALVSNTISKAKLCVAASELCAARTNVAYFPAYEIIMAPDNAHRYFEDDRRHITEIGVAHVMGVFFRHFRRHGSAASAKPVDASAEAKIMRALVCDENLLDRP